MKKSLWQHIETVREKSPLVHNITNFVVMNNTANALLAIGASPVMAQAHSEVEDMTAIANALVINIGTLDEYLAAAMLMAASKADQLQKPWILDPVGAGATHYRNEILQQLLAFKPTVIRANASEIMALASVSSTTKGVDSTAQSSDAVAAAQTLVREFNTTVCISGATDYIIDHSQTIQIHNGHQMMTKVTGLGCSATALIGAFIGVIDNKTEAITAAMALMGIAGELAAIKSNGPGSLQLNLLDHLYAMDEAAFSACLKIEMQ